MITLDNLILNVALPTLVRELHASTSELQWIVDAYILVFAGLLLVGGSLGDRFGRARVLRHRSGRLRYRVGRGGVLDRSDGPGGVPGRHGRRGSPDPPDLGRGPDQRVHRTPGNGSARSVSGRRSAGLGLALGPVLGGVLLDRSSGGAQCSWSTCRSSSRRWRWGGGRSRSPGTRRRHGSIRWASCSRCSACRRWSGRRSRPRRKGGASAATLRSFAVVIVLFVCFVVWETRCAHPMLEVGYFRNRRFSVANLTRGTAGFAFAGTLFVLTQLLQFVFGYSPLTAGIRLVPLAAIMMVGGLLGPRLAEAVGTSRAVALGLADLRRRGCWCSRPSATDAGLSARPRSRPSRSVPGSAS